MDKSRYGTLTDREIIDCAERNELICEDFVRENVKQACYELRVGNYYYDLSNETKRIEIEEDGYVLLRPFQRVVIITKEKLNIPSNILARILTKGALFSLGILPVNTYADPGFYGRLGIVLHNASHHYLKLKYKESIAKIEFDRLQVPVERPYRGQHGYETNIWPIQEEDHILQKSELEKELGYISDINEIEYAFGKRVANIFRKIFVYEKRFLTVCSIYFMIMIIFIGMLDWIANGNPVTTTIVSVFAGVGSNLLFLLAEFFIRGRK